MYFSQFSGFQTVRRSFALLFRDCDGSFFMFVRQNQSGRLLGEMEGGRQR